MGSFSGADSINETRGMGPNGAHHVRGMVSHPHKAPAGTETNGIEKPVCATSGCETRLESHNKEGYCWTHPPPRYPRFRI